MEMTQRCNKHGSWVIGSLPIGSKLNLFWALTEEIRFGLPTLGDNLHRLVSRSVSRERNSMIITTFNCFNISQDHLYIDWSQ